LQGGDCAESFAEFSADNIRDTFKVILQMAMVLTWGAKVPVVKIGRIAGQFAKPRSAADRGDWRCRTASPTAATSSMVSISPPPPATPDPARMLQAYTQAAASLNLLRAFSTGGYADIHRVQSWISGFTDESDAERYREIANQIQDALDFMAAAGVTSEDCQGTLHRGFLHQPRGAATGI
jgi:3-deoxy-7-phosphoheptulonate synthase